MSGQLPPPPPGFPPPGAPPGGPPAGPPSGGPPSWAPPGPPPKQGRGLLVALIIGLVLLVAVVVVLVVLLVNGSDDDGDKGGKGSGDNSKTSGGSDEEQIEAVVVEAFTRWGEAETGDEDACEGIDQYFVTTGDDTAEEACRSEAGSQSGTLLKVEATEIEVDGDEATAQVNLTVEGNQEEGDEDVDYPVDLVKDDGDWKIKQP